MFFRAEIRHLDIATRMSRRFGSVGWVMLCLCLALLSSIAAPDLDKTQALALQRYGPAAAESVAAWRRMLEEARPLSDPEKLAKVNTFFNRRILFKSDQEVYHQEDYWASPLEFMGIGAGDCEDFSIAKYVSLQMIGIDNQHLRMIYVRAKTGSLPAVAHMVLGYYPQPTDEPLILDNLVKEVKPASQRPDLEPVYSFNDDDIWLPSGNTRKGGASQVRLWRELLEKLAKEQRL